MTVRTNVPAPSLGVSRYGLMHSVGGESGVRDFMRTHPAEGGADRWENGFLFLYDTCSGSGDAQDPCGPTFNTPVAVEGIADETPYLIWESESCSTFGNDAINLDGRVSRLLERSTSKQIEQEMYLGTRATATGWNNRFLTDTNAVILGGGTATPFLHSLTLLQGGIGRALDGARAMIHCTLETASKWFTYGGIYVKGNLLVDAFDNIIVPGIGYDGSAPSGQTAASANESWAMATDLIGVRLSGIKTTETLNARIDKDNNVDVVVARRTAHATYQCDQQAVLIDLCTVNCTAA